MANDDQNNPRRHLDRPEDNPFIAFRRFADSQVSSLLNTVFTLPATIANYSNAHSAREQCLFGRADEQQCEKLLNLEKQASEIRHQGRELYLAGDVQAVLKKSDELVQLDRQADDLRRDILVNAGDSHEKELLERVGAEKGQQWGWSHSWGLPAPLEDERAATQHQNRGAYTRSSQNMTQLEKQWTEFESQVQSWLKNETARALWGDEPVKSDKRREQEDFKAVSLENRQNEISDEEAWHARTNPTSRDRPLALFDAFGDVITESLLQLTRPHLPPTAHPYSPAALEANVRLNHIPWRAAFEDLIRTQHGAPLIPSPAHPKTISHPQWPHPFDPEPTTSSTTSTNYSSYPHDHSDQPDDASPHDAPLSNQDTPATELDFYERLDSTLPPSQATTSSPSLSPSSSLPPPTSASSVLSSLTTTERTTAPDGTVTTRTVLRKRFADGREESSESVHTQHREAGAAGAQAEAEVAGQKKGGWFWSGRG